MCITASPSSRALRDSLRKSFRATDPLSHTTGEERSRREIYKSHYSAGVSGREFVAGRWGESRRDDWVMEIAANENRGSGFWFGFLAIFAVCRNRRSIRLETRKRLGISKTFGGILCQSSVPNGAQRDVTNAASNHAQPHWHFARSRSHIEDVVRAQKASEFGEAREVPRRRSRVALFAGLPDLGKFHFAMSPIFWEGDALKSQILSASSIQINFPLGSGASQITLRTRSPTWSSICPHQKSLK